MSRKTDHKWGRVHTAIFVENLVKRSLIPPITGSTVVVVPFQSSISQIIHATKLSSNMRTAAYNQKEPSNSNVENLGTKLIHFLVRSPDDLLRGNQILNKPKRRSGGRRLRSGLVESRMLDNTWFPLVPLRVEIECIFSTTRA
jgi:hypothetical protein